MIREDYVMWLLFGGLANPFSFLFFLNLFSYQYLNGMCFTYAGLYEI